jgi:hypothetical protein
MPQSPVPNTAEAVLNYQSDSGDARNVLHFRQEPFGNWTNIDLSRLAETLADWWVTNLKPLVHPAYTLESVIARDLGAVPGEVAEYGVGQTGGAQGGRSPSNVTTAFTLRTALGGRSGRGRIYHVGLSQNYYVGDTLNPNEKNIMVAAYDTLKVISKGSIGYEYHLMVVSRFANKVQRASGIANEVTNVSNDGLLDSQRRRLKGRGA